MSNEECGEDGFCSMNQEDSDRDRIGDACDSTYNTTTTTTTTETCLPKKIYGVHSEETELFRNFRDEVLSKTPEGQELIRLYYQWSPIIVKAMEEDDAFTEEVKEFIDGILGFMRTEG